jgi:hypothetical protein
MKSSEYTILWPDEGTALLDGGKPNYNAFISGLLGNPSTTKEDRERIVALLLKERDKGFVTESQVVQIIKQYTDPKSPDGGEGPNNPTDIDTSKGDTSDETELIYKSPKDTRDFLVAYNQDNILKYTCHNIDDEDVINEINIECGVTEYDFEKHLQIIQEHFNRLKKGRFVYYRILNLISAYLTGKTVKGEATGWSSLNIQENWACEKLNSWAKNNSHVVPNPGENIASSIRNSGYKLSKPYVSSLTGERIIYFSQLVLYFKSLFHIKADNSLKSILEYVNSTEKYSEKNIKIIFDKIFLEKTELFAYVDPLVQAYKSIINICSESCDSNCPDGVNIELSFYEDEANKKKCFCIHHLNTVYGKSPLDAITRIGDKQKLLIKNQINGNCDLYIQALFEDGFSYEINLWNGDERTYNRIEDIQGVKYIMKYYI